MVDTNLSMVRGDTLAFGLEFEGLEQDLDSAYFTCKANATLSDYVFQKTLEDGIDKVATGKYRVRVDPVDTSTVEAREYYYDLVIGVNDDVFTLLKGVLSIEQNVTSIPTT